MHVVRKRIVATTEGGAIASEESLRKHTDQLYGAILSYGGHARQRSLGVPKCCRCRRACSTSTENCLLACTPRPATTLTTTLLRFHQHSRPAQQLLVVNLLLAADNHTLLVRAIGVE